MYEIDHRRADLIPMVIHNLLHEPTLEPIKDLTFPSNVTKPVDLKSITKKNYKAFDDLCSDFAWFIHNCLTINRNDRDVPKAANAAIEILNRQIRELKLCDQCYQISYVRPNEPMTTVCDPPHRLLWVNCAKYGYWPAKMLRFEDDGQLTVRFFGDKTISTVSPDECLMYSVNIPENDFGSGAGTPPFDEAIQEVTKYIENFEKSGRFVFATVGTPFNQNIHQQEAIDPTEETPQSFGNEKTNTGLESIVTNESSSSNNAATKSCAAKIQDANTTDSDSDQSIIESPIITSPVRSKRAGTEIGGNDGSPDHQHEPKRRMTNDGLIVNESGLGSDLCDLIEEHLKKNVSRSFSQLRSDIAAKDNHIALLEEKLQDVTKEKESLTQSYAVEREALEKQMSDLREKSKKKTCVHCEADLDQPNFCSSGCLEAYVKKTP